VRRALECQRPGQADDAGLGGAVVGEPGHALVGDLRGEVDDAAEAAGTHARIDRLRHEERAAQMHCDHPVPARERHRLEGRLVDDAGAAHQDVDRADLALDPLDGPRDRVRLGDVAFKGERRTAVWRDLGDEALRVRGVAQMQNGDRRTFGRERPRDRSTNAATAPGDQYDPALELAV
jgi:hypothetical protein